MQVFWLTATTVFQVDMKVPTGHVYSRHMTEAWIMNSEIGSSAAMITRVESDPE